MIGPIRRKGRNFKMDGSAVTDSSSLTLPPVWLAIQNALLGKLKGEGLGLDYHLANVESYYGS